jgi:pimeloyl-ACP methyl ester carboxylesterase
MGREIWGSTFACPVHTYTVGLRSVRQQGDIRVIHNFLRIIALASLSLATATLSSNAKAEDEKPTVVLVHGAFADGSSWGRVIPLLQAEGLRVISVQNPLTSLADDVDAVTRVLDAQSGPVVLVGHSWGGSVITQAGTHENVAALVYIAAAAPDAGQSTNDLLAGAGPLPWQAELIADPAGFGTLSEAGVSSFFAQDVSPERAQIIFATQGPLKLSAFDDKLTSAAWHDKPSWYLVADNDKILPPEGQAQLAATIKATTTHLSSSHVPFVSKPRATAQVILSAVKAVATK